MNTRTHTSFNRPVRYAIRWKQTVELIAVTASAAAWLAWSFWGG